MAKMRSPSADLYGAVEDLQTQLIATGHEVWSMRLRDAKLSGATSGEILGAIRAVLLDFRDTDVPDSTDTVDHVNGVIAVIDAALGPPPIRPLNYRRGEDSGST